MIARAIRSLIDAAVPALSSIAMNGSPVVASEPEPNFDELVAQALQRYHDRLDKHGVAIRELHSHEAHLGRLNNALREEEEAKHQFDADEAAAAQSAKEWAASGALPTIGEKHARAVKRLSLSREHRDRLGILASGARAAMPEVEQELGIARSRLRNAADAVEDSLFEIAEAMLARDICQMRRAREQFIAARMRIAGLEFRARSKTFLGHHSPRTSERLQLVLRESEIPELPDTRSANTRDREAVHIELRPEAERWDQVFARLELEASLEARVQ